MRATLLSNFPGKKEGAMRNEFFTHLIHDINDNMFDGPANRRTPKNQWGLEKEFELQYSSKLTFRSVA